MTCVSKCKIHIKLVNSATKFITSCSLRQVTTMSYPNIKSSTFFAILIVKFQIIECSFAIEYCPEDLELKPRGTSTDIEPPDYCKLSSCLPDPTTLSKIRIWIFTNFQTSQNMLVSKLVFFQLLLFFRQRHDNLYIAPLNIYTVVREISRFIVSNWLLDLVSRVHTYYHIIMDSMLIC